MAESETQATGGSGEGAALGSISVQTTPAGQSATLPPPGQAAAPPAATTTEKTLSDFVPESYREKEWVKNTFKSDNPAEALFSQFENAQKILGNPVAAAIPGKDATPEQIEKYHKALGVPDDYKTGYPYEAKWDEADKAYGEAIEAMRKPEIMDGLREAAKKLGVTPEQFAGLAKAQDELTLKFGREMIDADLSQFESLMDKAFGANKGKVIDDGREMINKLLPGQEWQNQIVGLPNEALVVLAAVTQQLHSQFVKPDSFNPASTTNATPALSDADKQKRIAELQADSAWKNKFDPRYETVNKEWRKHMGLPN